MRKINLFTILFVLGFLAAGATSMFAQIQPDQARTNEMRKRNICRDPWITWAHLDASAGIYDAVGFGDYGQCDPRWYNNGSWSNYTELYNAVKEYRNSLSQAGVTWSRLVQPNGTIAFVADVGGEKYGAIAKGLKLVNGNLVGNDGASLVGNDGASLVAAGGGNLVAAGGGNLVAAGGGNYQLLSGEKKRIKVGRNTYLVIKK